MSKRYKEAMIEKAGENLDKMANKMMEQEKKQPLRLKPVSSISFVHYKVFTGDRKLYDGTDRKEANRIYQEYVADPVHRLRARHVYEEIKLSKKCETGKTEKDKMLIAMDHVPEDIRLVMLSLYSSCEVPAPVLKAAYTNFPNFFTGSL